MKKPLLVFFLSICIANISFAQKKAKATKDTKVVESATPKSSIDLSVFKNLKARNIGPGTMSGRVTTVDAVQDNPDIIYAGTASGGVWKTENGGMTWTSIFDENPILNIGAVAIQQSNPNVVWVGTGEGNPRNTVNLGAGIYKSMDAGKTWKCMGLEKTSNIHRVIIDPTNPNIIYAGVIGNPFANHPERGVYKTTNGGETWERILFTNESSGTGDLVMDPTNPNKLIANMWEHKRTPYDFKSGGKGSGMYVTIDAGKTWKKIEEGLPKGDLGRMGIAIAASAPNIVYALVESSKNALYKSEDGGNSWKKLNEDEEVANNRPFYFFDIAVDPSNENRIYNVYQMISMSEDGGKSFKVIVPYSGVHPDHHAFWINPKDPSLIINGNDGGVAISRDRGRKWTFAESIPVGQFYHVKADNEIPYNVYGGLQDNGSWKGPAYTWMTGGIRNQYWEVVLFGDGFDVSPDPDNSRYGYAMSQGGSLARYDVLTGDAQYMKPTHPDKNVKLRYNWNSAFAQDPLDNNTIYYGSQFLHKSIDKGQNWTIVSPDLTTDNKAQQKASSESGGLTIDITSAENHNTILTISPSSKNKDIIWVGTDDGNVQITKDGGKTWKNVSESMPSLPKEAWIAQIRSSKYNEGEAFVVANNYRNGGGFIPYVYKTSDFGNTWQRIADENKVKGYALTILQDTEEPNLLFLGTEQGLWISFDGGSNFSQYKHGVPSVSTIDLSIQERESDLLIATFGRGIFVLDDIKPLREMAKKSFKDVKIKAFTPPTAYLSNIKDAPGIMFGGDELYEAENRKYGALLKVYIEKTQADSAKKSKSDTLFVKIFDSKNQLLRTLQQTVDSTGVHIINWGLDEKANRRPGSKIPKKGSPEYGGQSVLPGTYKVVYELKKLKDSTSIEVKSDPRIKFKTEDELEKRKLLNETQIFINKLTLAIDRLDETKEVVEKILNQTKESEDSTLIKLNKSSKSLLDSIKVTREIIIGKKFDKQGYGRPYILNALAKFGELNSYLRSKQKISESERIIANDVKELSNKELEKVNSFFENHWKKYKNMVENSPVNRLKDYEPLK